MGCQAGGGTLPTQCLIHVRCAWLLYCRYYDAEKYIRANGYKWGINWDDYMWVRLHHCFAGASPRLDLQAWSAIACMPCHMQAQSHSALPLAAASNLVLTSPKARPACLYPCRHRIGIMPPIPGCGWVGLGTQSCSGWGRCLVFSNTWSSGLKLDLLAHELGG